MAQNEDGRIVETATEARQGERGPSVLKLLIVSVTIALAAMAVMWFVFFKT
jgi:flagellar basal body-associated protein FliL